MVDVTDDTFETAVLERSLSVPVVVDLWAPWCGPCQALGPILEKVVAATNGAVELAKVNVDENPKVAGSFQVQSIPAVFAIKDGKIADQFIGGLPEAEVEAFVARLLPAASEADLLARDGAASGDEALLRSALELEPDHAGAVVALAALLIGAGQTDEALAVLGRIPENPETRSLAAEARLKARGIDQVDVARLDGLLDSVRGDEAARQEFLDLLEAMGPDDPRTATYRRSLASRLF